MTATVLLTLDTELAAANGAEPPRETTAPIAAAVERFCKLLDTHAISGSWLIHPNTPGSLIGAIRAMRTRQDLLPRPRTLGLPRAGVAFATRIHALSGLHGQVESLLAAGAGRGHRPAEWMLNALRLVGFRSALDRAIRSGAVCHVHLCLAELRRRPAVIRLFEDLLFRLAEERRSRRVRILTVSDARRTMMPERVTEAA